MWAVLSGLYTSWLYTSISYRFDIRSLSFSGSEDEEGIKTAAERSECIIISHRGLQWYENFSLNCGPIN